MLEERLRLEFHRAAKAGVAHEFLSLHATNANAHDLTSEYIRMRDQKHEAFDWKYNPIPPLLKAATSPVIQYVVLKRLNERRRKCQIGLTFLFNFDLILPETGGLILADVHEHYQQFLAAPACKSDCDDCFDEGKPICDEAALRQFLVANLAGAVALTAPDAVNIRRMSREPLTLAMLIHMIADAAGIGHPAQRLIVTKNFPQELRERLFARAEDLVLAAQKDEKLLSEFSCCREVIEDILDEIEG